MLEQIRAQIRALLDERSAKQVDLDAVIAGVEARGETDFSDEETATFNEARAAIDEIDGKVAPLEAREAELVALAERRDRAESVLAGLPAVEGSKPTVRVGREELTYRKGGQHDFLADAYSARFGGDSAASERIQRSNAEMAVEYRATTTTSFTTGLVIPQYLVDQFAPFARAGRPFIDAIGSLNLPPDGMTLNIPRLTTSSAVAAQATENSAVQNTDVVASLLTVNVNTYSGQQDVSRQAVERGTGITDIVLADLVADYAAKLDAGAINGAGTGGTHLGVLNTGSVNSVTLSTATTVALFPKLADAIQRVNSNRFVPANLIVMHPRRWGSLLASLDSSNRPLVVPGAAYGAFNVMGEGVSGAPHSNVGAGVVGSILGVPVLIDANIPTNLGGGTNEDRIIVMAAQDTKLFEQPGSPLQLRFEEILGNQLTVKLVVYGFSAFTAARYPAGISVISGAGLVTPTF